MTRVTHIALAVAIVTGLSATAFAQRGMGGGPMNYDVSTEITLSGVVDDVKQMQMPAGGRGMGGLHLIFSAGTGSIEVHVGPAAYVAEQKFTFTKGDALTIVGSKVVMNGTDVVLAREITQGGRVLTLRDDQGRPRWSGRGRMSR